MFCPRLGNVAVVWVDIQHWCWEEMILSLQKCTYMHYAAMLFFLFFFFPVFSFVFTSPPALTSSYISSTIECVQEAKPPTMKPRIEANATVNG